MTVQGDESRAEVTPLPGSFRSPQDRRMNFVLEARGRLKRNVLIG